MHRVGSLVPLIVLGPKVATVRVAFGNAAGTGLQAVREM